MSKRAGLLLNLLPARQSISYRGNPPPFRSKMTQGNFQILAHMRFNCSELYIYPEVAVLNSQHAIYLNFQTNLKLERERVDINGGGQATGPWTLTGRLGEWLVEGVVGPISFV